MCSGTPLCGHQLYTGSYFGPIPYLFHNLNSVNKDTPIIRTPFLVVTVSVIIQGLAVFAISILRTYDCQIQRLNLSSPIHLSVSVRCLHAMNRYKN